MKRKLSLLLAMVLAMTMVMGMNLTALAYAGPPEGCPERVDSCEHPGTEPGATLAYVYELADKVKVAQYNSGNGMWFTNGEVEYGQFGDTPTLDTVYHLNVDWLYYLCQEPSPTPTPTPTPAPSSPTHVHEWVEGEIYAATQDSDGLEGIYCKTCGAIKESHPISAYSYSLNNYASPMINAAKAGQTITFEFGEWNSFPKSFMEKLVNKSAQGVTFVFHYKWNHVKQEITIPAGTPIDLNFDWYGPAKMAELYGAY